MNNKTIPLIFILVLLAACVPTAVPTGSETEQPMITETAVATLTTPVQLAPTTVTSQPAPTTTPWPTVTPETAVMTIPPIPTTAPSDACPPNQPESLIPYSPNAIDYRGKQFAELPAEWEDWGGYTVGNYQHHIRKVKQQNIVMLWLEKEICRHYHTTHSSAHLKITDVLFLPMEEDTGNGLRLIESTCWKVADYPADSAVEEKERWVDTLLAIGHFEDSDDAPTEILFAWEINLETGQFEELPPETVACTGLLGL